MGIDSSAVAGVQASSARWEQGNFCMPSLSSHPSCSHKLQHLAGRVELSNAAALTRLTRSFTMANLPSLACSPVIVVNVILPHKLFLLFSNLCTVRVIASSQELAGKTARKNCIQN